MEPLYRPRRLRAHPTLRRMVQETHLRASQLIYPVFVCEGRGVKEEIPSMPGQYRFSVDRLQKEMEEVCAAGVPAVILFGIPDPSEKDEEGSAAHHPRGVVCRALESLRGNFPDLILIADVCLCEYTSHGHCGVISGDGQAWRVDNDRTLPLLARAAVAYGAAGAHVVAPSDMMDGRVAAIREALDGEGLQEVAILSYAAKYASAFYGPFRDAAGSAPQFGDRRSYQMDPANWREALREVELDIEEGADLIMVKPALPYLDVIQRVRSLTDLPLAAYQVSGEYAALVAAFQKGWLQREAALLESLLSIRRAGADLILTYFAKEAARLLAAG